LTDLNAAEFGVKVISLILELQTNQANVKHNITYYMLTK
jgi:hypothetical protein